MNFVKEANNCLAPVIIKNLEKRNFEGYFCQTKEEALIKALSLISENSTVSWGGSASIQEIGLLDALKEKNLNIIDRETATSPEERLELMRQALLADTYLMSTNALTTDGILVNIDGNGNRVAALCFGPKQVIMIVGINKIVEDEEAALARIQLEACRPNCLRFNLNNPCVLTGKCGNCLQDSICSQIVYTRNSRTPNRLKVILVNEVLGF